MRDISPEQMYEKLMSQKGIIQEMVDTEGDDTEVVSISQKDLLKATMVTVEGLVNLLVNKGLVQAEDVIGYCGAAKEAMAEIFPEEHFGLDPAGNEEDEEEGS